jgi:hypothetical protein
MAQETPVAAGQGRLVETARRRRRLTVEALRLAVGAPAPFAPSDPPAAVEPGNATPALLDATVLQRTQASSMAFDLAPFG